VSDVRVLGSPQTGGSSLNDATLREPLRSLHNPPEQMVRFLTESLSDALSELLILRCFYGHRVTGARNLASENRRSLLPTDRFTQTFPAVLFYGFSVAARPPSGSAVSLISYLGTRWHFAHILFLLMCEKRHAWSLP